MSINILYRFALQKLVYHFNVYIVTISRVYYVSRVELPTEKRVKRWALSMEELVMDPTGMSTF